MINKLLITCLQRNKRLVIPTLGAFIRKNIEGVGVILVFVPFLNKDDGVLCSAIKSWAGVDDEEAAQILDEYIVAVKKSLDDRGQYIIEGVGVLKYDTNGIIYLAKESEAIKDEVVKPTQEQKAELPQEESVQKAVEVQPIQVEPKSVLPPVAAPVPVPEPVPIVVNSEVKPAVEVVTDSNNNDDEPIKEPQVPQYNRPLYDRSQVTTDMGTRYFSPVRKPEESVPVVEKTENETPRQSSVRSMYDQQQQKESTNQNPTQSYGRYRDSQQRISSIYGSTNNSATPPPAQGQQTGERVIASPIANGQRLSRAAASARPQQMKKKKGNDMVLWIAIIAVALTVMVLVYGYIYGGEQTIDTEALIEQVKTEAATDGAAQPTEGAPSEEIAPTDVK